MAGPLVLAHFESLFQVTPVVDLDTAPLDPARGFTYDNRVRCTLTIDKPSAGWTFRQIGYGPTEQVAEHNACDALWKVLAISAGGIEFDRESANLVSLQQWAMKNFNTNPSYCQTYCYSTEHARFQYQTQVFVTNPYITPPYVYSLPTAIWTETGRAGRHVAAGLIREILQHHHPKLTSELTNTTQVFGVNR